MGEFTMPSLGADMTEGTLTEWLVQPGDHVRKGDIVAVVDTAKADIEVECFESGVVERLLVEPGTLVPVGTALAVITAEAAAPAEVTPPAGGVPASGVTVASPDTATPWRRGPAAPTAAGGPVRPAEPPAPAEPGPSSVPVAPAARPARPVEPPTVPAGLASSSPLIRHLAQERGVDLAAVHGTGRGGRITRADVLEAQLAAPPPTPPTARASRGAREAAPAAPGGAPGAATGRPRRGRTEVPSAPAAGQGRDDLPVAPPAAPESARGGPVGRSRHRPARPQPAPTRATRPVADRVRATPLARRLAAEAGLDLTVVQGTGAQGAVSAEDVRAELRRPAQAGPRAPGDAAGHPSVLAGPQAPSVPARPPAGAPAGARPPAGQAAAGSHAVAASRAEAMRRAIGDLMARSKHEIPHYYLATTVDLAAATDWLRERNLKVPVTERLVPAALLLKAAACAAREVPALNGFWIDGGFVPAPAVHLGVAVSLRGGGLVAPAIHDAADLPLPEIMARLRDLVARARAGRLRGSETADPTITVTSLGDQGVEAVFGVIYPPQVALVGLGKVVERPCAVGGLLGVRPVVTATLSADHRASDGATGARYLTAFDRMLQRPEEL